MLWQGLYSQKEGSQDEVACLTVGFCRVLFWPLTFHGEIVRLKPEGPRFNSSFHEELSVIIFHQLKGGDRVSICASWASLSVGVMWQYGDERPVTSTCMMCVPYSVCSM